MSKDTDYKENEIAIDKDVADPTKYNHYYEGVTDEKYVYDLAKLTSVPDADCFVTIPQPGTGDYLTSTKLIDIASIREDTNVTSILDGIQTVTFTGGLMHRDQVPTTWTTWSSPPDSESATPPVLSSLGSNSITMTLSKPSCTFGFELEPSSFGTFSYTVQFYADTDLIGTITENVNGDSGARLFAAKSCCCDTNMRFDKVVISGEAGSDGFAIAQVRYSIDCSSDCECCCEAPVPVTFEECEDLKNVPITVDHFSCRGRLLIVDVNVTACENRKVAIGVLICDNDSNVLRFKVCEACMPESVNDNHCVTNTIRFCFVFGTDLCSQLSLNVKTFAEYACLDFPCNCQS